MYQTIIFDLDGTLLYTLEDLTDGVNYTLNTFGYPSRTIHEIRSFVGNGIERLMRLALPSDLHETKFQEVFAFFKDYYTSHCQVKTRPYDNILDLLKELKHKGHQLAIVSNKNDAAVKALSEYYFQDIISLAVGERDGIRRKPYPDSVLEVIRNLGANPETTLYVGDSEVDYQTADNAGIDCILVSWGFRDRDVLEALEPKAVIDVPDELNHFIL